MSAVGPVPPTAAGVGADLRAAREQAGWTLPQLAGSLRIRLVYLEAMEEGRIGLLPGNAYAVAFMRSYAQALGLDPEEIVRRFRREAAEVNQRTELEFPAPVPERGIPAGAILVIGLVIAIGGYAVWWHGGGAPAPAPRVAQIPARLAAIAQSPQGATTHTPPARGSTVAAAMPPGIPAIPPAIAPGGTADARTAQATNGAAGPKTADTVVPAASATLAGAQKPASPPTNAQAAVAPLPDVSPASALAATPAVPPIVTLAHAATDATAADTIVLGATADAWLEVRDPLGHVLLNKILHPGDTWTVPNRTGLVLTTGNAGGTTVTVGSLVIPSLGGNGTVRRDLPLDAAVIRAGGLAARTVAAHQAASATN